MIVATAGVTEVQVPPVTEELNDEFPFTQIAVDPEMVPAEGAADTVTVVFVTAFAQPPEPARVYEMTEVPALTGLTTPVAVLTVATAVVAEAQVPPEIDALNVEVEPPVQSVEPPVTVATLVGALTVTVAVVVAFAHPPVPDTVYVITDVPAVKPETIPEELIVATAGVAEDQVPPVTGELKVEVPLEQMAVVPEIVPAEGAAVTVIVLVAVAFEQPPVPVTVYVMVAVPAATPVIVPPEAEAMLVLEEVQAPPETVEVKVVVEPTHTDCVPDKLPAEVAGLIVSTRLSVAV